jgi:broad specificity phosphatase PhoE
MTTFSLIRHGEADWQLGRDRKLKGWAFDLVPLTQTGVEQIEQAAALLQPVQAEIILASPMTRSLQSAAILTRHLAIPLVVEFDLHEWVPDLSLAWENGEQVQAAWADLTRHHGEWPAGETRGWEPISTVRRRMLGVLERYRQHDRAIVVSHTVSISSLTGRDSRYAEITEYQC